MVYPPQGTSALRAAVSALLAGQILFPDINGFIIQDSNLFWDNINKRLGIKTSSPNTDLDVNGTIGGRPSTGTGVFTIDVTNNSVTGALTIAINTTATPFGNINSFSGLIIIDDTVSGNTGLFLTGQGAMVLVAQTGTGFTTTQGTANKINVYLSTFVVTIENKITDPIKLNVASIRTRPSQ